MFLNSGKSLEDVFHIRVTTRTLTLKSAHDFHTETQAKQKKIKIDERVPTKIRHEKKGLQRNDASLEIDSLSNLGKNVNMKFRISRILFISLTVEQTNDFLFFIHKLAFER